MLQTAVRFVSDSSRTVLGLVAVVITTVSAAAFLALLALELTGIHLSPYLGIVTFMVLPGGFLLGLGLLAVAKIRVRRARARGGMPQHLDLGDPAVQRRLVVVAGLSAVNLAILGLSGYHGVHFMDTTGFCGKVCHQVMEPEFTAYQGSPHARVSCTGCHIGPGASWFVKSKLSGTRQVLAVAFDTYERPVPAPIENLRPARETCEQCHWPEKFHGDRIKVRTHYEDDEANTELKTVLLLKVGGGSLESGFAEGIHWHMSLANRIDYRASHDRTTMYWVRVENHGGEAREYWLDGADMPRDSILALPSRRMDCVDCHNRPTHAFALPGNALDAVLQRGEAARDLPYLKRQALELLRAEHPSKEAAMESFDDSLLAFYRREYPEIAASRGGEIEAAAKAMRDIYARNIFPKMGVTWGTYPNHLGHENDSGCFRCHDEQHTSDDGQTISQDCSNCHNLLAMQEESPAVLQSLYGTP